MSTLETARDKFPRMPAAVVTPGMFKVSKGERTDVHNAVFSERRRGDFPTRNRGGDQHWFPGDLGRHGLQRRRQSEAREAGADGPDGSPGSSEASRSTAGSGRAAGGQASHDRRPGAEAKAGRDDPSAAGGNEVGQSTGTRADQAGARASGPGGAVGTGSRPRDLRRAG